MVSCPSLPQETINLINEDNSGLELVSETKYSSHCHSNNIPISVYSTHTQKKNNWHQYSRCCNGNITYNISAFHTDKTRNYYKWYGFKICGFL